VLYPSELRGLADKITLFYAAARLRALSVALAIEDGAVRNNYTFPLLAPQYKKRGNVRIKPTLAR